MSRLIWRVGAFRKKECYSRFPFGIKAIVDGLFFSKIKNYKRYIGQIYGPKEYASIKRDGSTVIVLQDQWSGCMMLSGTPWPRSIFNYY
ncbi:MAG: hypothetical protein ACI8YQ_000937 [Polaribacter sp.]|jgi:hypothetical protein